MNRDKKIVTNNFKIEKNIINFSESLIQISNISYVSIEPVPKKKFHLESIILFIVGLIIYLSSEFTSFIGLIIIVMSTIYISWYLIFNMDSDKKYLCIYLNSGHTYYFFCNDVVFLKDVVKVIKYCVNNHSVNKIKIDFEDCKIYNSPITVGNRNEVNQ